MRPVRAGVVMVILAAGSGCIGSAHDWDFDERLAASEAVKGECQADGNASCPDAVCEELVEQEFDECLVNDVRTCELETGSDGSSVVHAVGSAGCG